MVQRRGKNFPANPKPVPRFNILNFSFKKMHRLLLLSTREGEKCTVQEKQAWAGTGCMCGEKQVYRKVVGGRVNGLSNEMMRCF